MTRATSTEVGGSSAAVIDLVSLEERERYLRGLRVGLVVLVMVLGLLVPGPASERAGALAVGSLIYLAASGMLEGLRALFVSQRRRVLGAALMVDALYLVWVNHQSGGVESPLRTLIVLHVVAVVLSASYRTGLKIALWHSLLLFLAYDAGEAHMLGLAGSRVSHAVAYRELIVFITVLWVMAFITASFSALNERELRRRRVEMEGLAEMAADLEATTDPVSIAEIVLNRVADTLGFERGLVVAGPPEGRLALLAHRGLGRVPHDPATPIESDPESVVTRALASRHAILQAGLDGTTDPWLAELLGSDSRLVIAPLSGEGSAVGALVLVHPTKAGPRLHRRMVAMVERFASYSGLALRNAWLLAQVTRRAATDGLTGIANRRSFDTNLSRELGRARRSGEPVSLVMIDIDHFKKLNDERGHQVGDDVLRRVATLLGDHSRDFDTAARYGGEEFALILPSCPPETASATAERMRQLIADSTTDLGVTVSAGVACFPSDAEDAFSLIGAADQALYFSKRAGRNRVTTATQVSEAPRAALRPDAERSAPIAAEPVDPTLAETFVLGQPEHPAVLP